MYRWHFQGHYVFFIICRKQSNNVEYWWRTSCSTKGRIPSSDSRSRNRCRRFWWWIQMRSPSNLHCSLGLAPCHSPLAPAHSESWAFLQPVNKTYLWYTYPYTLAHEYYTLLFKIYINRINESNNLCIGLESWMWWITTVRPVAFPISGCENPFYVYHTASTYRDRLQNLLVQKKYTNHINGSKNPVTFV